MDPVKRVLSRAVTSFSVFLPRLSAVMVAVVTVCALVVVGCGGTKSRGQHSAACDPQIQDPIKENRRPFFLTRKLTGAAADGALFLYQIDTAKGTARPVLNRGNESTDSVVYRDVSSQRVFWLERLMGRLSRLTRLSCNDTVPIRELGGLPENTFGMGTLGNGKILALGWNEGRISIFAEDFSQTVVQNEPLAGQPSGGATDKSDQHLNTILRRGTAAYVLSTGYDLGRFSPAPAKFFRFETSGRADFSDSSESSDLRLSDPVVVPECYNAYQEYTLQLSPDAMVMGCNPQFSGSNDFPVRLVWAGIDESGNLSMRQLPIRGPGDANLLVPGGARGEGRWVLITEQGVTAESQRTTNPGRTLRSYWLDTVSGETRDMKRFGGSVVFDEAERVYVLSCVVPEASVLGECAKNRFAILPEDQWDQPDLAKVIEVTYEYDFLQFERKMY